MSELPQGWSSCVLGDLTAYVTSGSRDWSKYYSADGALFVRTENINKNRLGSLSDIAHVSLPETVEGKRTLIKRDDLLITITGANVGKCAHVDLDISEAYVSQSVALVRFLDKSIARFIHLQLIAPDPDGTQTILQKNAYGLGRPVLNLDNVREVPIKLPPFSEQLRIADKLEALLSQVDACRDRLDRIPEILKRFRQSVLAAATSGALTEDWREANESRDKWKEVQLGEVARDFSYGSAAKSSKSGAVPVLRMGNIQDGCLDWNDLVYTSDPAEFEKYRLVSGDVLFNRTNSPELVGKTCVFKGERDAIYAGYLIRVRCSPKLLPDYLNYCLGSPAGRDYCWQVKSDGVSQSNINAKKLAAFDFLLPSVAEQAEIVRRVETLFTFADRLEARYTAAHAQVEKLTPSLLAKAFRGELVPQDPNDEPATELLARIRATTGRSTAKATRGRKSATAK